MTMTVNEALTSLRQMVDMGWIPNPEPVETIRRYVEEVREAEELCSNGSIVQRKLAAAREGRDDD